MLWHSNGPVRLVRSVTVGPRRVGGLRPNSVKLMSQAMGGVELVQVRFYW